MAENLENKSKTVSPQIQETFSYSWYPTQCKIGSSSTGESSSNLRVENSTETGRESYRVFKSDDNEEEMIVVEQATPGHSHTMPISGGRAMGSKFSEQQSRILMVSWKELYDKKRYPPTYEADWREIANKVNMAPGSYKTIKQVKKKFKNLRDRYRAAKVKNRKKGTNFGKSNAMFYAEFEQVYGNEDYPITSRQPRQRFAERDIEPSKNALQITGVTSATSTAIIPTINSVISKQLPRCVESAVSGGVTEVLPAAPAYNIAAKPLQEHAASSTRQHIAAGKDHTFWAGLPPKEDAQGHPQLINAVRELQQQQITMQREITRNMKQMEERILTEVSSRIKESEDRFRQQIANALTQLGNLIRIT